MLIVYWVRGKIIGTVLCREQFLKFACLFRFSLDLGLLFVCFLWSPYEIGQTIIFLPYGFFFFLSFFSFLA